MSDIPSMIHDDGYYEPHQVMKVRKSVKNLRVIAQFVTTIMVVAAIIGLGSLGIWRHTKTVSMNSSEQQHISNNVDLNKSHYVSTNTIWKPHEPSIIGLANTMDEADDDWECTKIESTFEEYSKKNPQATMCSFVQEQCRSNYVFRLYYCAFLPTLGNIGSRILFYCISIYALLVLFYMLADTTDEYFAPSLIELSRYLRLPPNVSGVTLLALGSGAPELCSIIAGLVNDNSDLALSAPLGSGVFVITIVLACVVLAKPVKVARRPFIRDVLSYLISCIYLFIVYLDTKVRLWEALISLFLYVVYVLIVIVGRMIYQRLKKRRLAKKKSKKAPELGDKLLENDALDKEEPESKKDLDSEEVELTLEGNKDEDSEEDEEESSIFKILADDGETHSAIDDKSARDKGMQYVPRIGMVAADAQGRVVKTKMKDLEKKEDEGEAVLHVPEKDIKVEENYLGHIEDDYEEPENEVLDEHTTLGKIRKLFGWDDKSIFDKFIFVTIGWYCTFLRNLTIPKSDEGAYMKIFHVLSPFFGTLFLIYLAFDLFELWYKWSHWYFLLIAILMVIATLVSVATLITAPSNRYPIYQPIFVTYAFVMCMGWTFFLANLLVQFLEVLGATMYLPPSVLGITVLAWGNCVGDLIANIAIARKGFPGMAIAACFAGPLLNLLIGVGIAFSVETVKSSIKAGNTKSFYEGLCSTIQTDAAVTFSFIFLILILALTLVAVPLMRWKIRRFFAIPLIILYFLYVAISLTGSLWDDMGNQVKKWHFGTPGCDSSFP